MCDVDEELDNLLEPDIRDLFIASEPNAVPPLGGTGLCNASYGARPTVIFGLFNHTRVLFYSFLALPFSFARCARP